MGNGLVKPSQDMNMLVTLMMPIYYIQEHDMTPLDICTLRESWERIICNGTAPYHRIRRMQTFTDDSCLSWFYSIFFTRMFHIYPTSRAIFEQNAQYQSKFLMRLVMTTMMCPSDNLQYSTAIKDLTSDLSSKGFRPYELGILGDVLFYSLQMVLGDAYSFTTDMCWKKAFSQLLYKAVPLCIAHEKRHANQFRLLWNFSDTPLASFASNSDSTK